MSLCVVHCSVRRSEGIYVARCRAYYRRCFLFFYTVCFNVKDMTSWEIRTVYQHRIKVRWNHFMNSSRDTIKGRTLYLVWCRVTTPFQGCWGIKEFIYGVRVLIARSPIGKSRFTLLHINDKSRISRIIESIIVFCVQPFLYHLFAWALSLLKGNSSTRNPWLSLTIILPRFSVLSIQFKRTGRLFYVE